MPTMAPPLSNPHATTTRYLVRHAYPDMPPHVFRVESFDNEQSARAFRHSINGATFASIWREDRSPRLITRSKLPD
ncbi:hypothetical protein [Thiocapsa sp. N5-Cardenillas]|uniref:hypothetical protein n=1 Tax=Thiocapsa sp. N5-Cardenillas TaxID=3137397 RepID=UPI0035AF6270